MLKQFRPGFTLIELVVVLSIILTIVSLSLSSISSARVRSRDAKRIADLHTIQSALEQHAFSYPLSPYPPTTSAVATYCNGQMGIYANSCFATFLAITPKDPRGQPYDYTHKGCIKTDVNQKFVEIVSPDPATGLCATGQRLGSYVLHAVLERPNTNEATNDATPGDDRSYDLMP